MEQHLNNSFFFEISASIFSELPSNKRCTLKKFHN